MAWCLVASYFFYAWWDWRFLPLLIMSTLVAYTSGIMIEKAQTRRMRLLWLWLCVAVHVGALAFFKYSAFLAGSLRSVLHWVGVDITHSDPGIILPVGISFYSFIAMNYVFDVSSGRIPKAERNILVFATYEGFFPHLLAGPIVRARWFLPQLHQDAPLTWSNIGRGLEMIIWGYFLKLCLAENAAIFTAARFNQPELFTSASLIAAVGLYAFQIYGDFAGYSLIAIGLSRMMGYDSGVNFNRPYFATSFSDFWRRWHISLSTWFRDYVYIPMGGSRTGVCATMRNLVVTMLIAGLWHGAGWHYAIWGLLHGLFLILQRLIAGPYSVLCRVTRCPSIVSRTVATICVFVLTCASWTFFRAESVSQAVFMLRSMLGWQSATHLSFGGMKYQLLRVGMLIAFALFVDACAGNKRLRAAYMSSTCGRAVGLAVVVVTILFTGSFGSNSFIYFQF
jgi:D-alanyl-lipoteichoic acid acyltransferase DltB (MBOAT superfamily)